MMTCYIYDLKLISRCRWKSDEFIVESPKPRTSYGSSNSPSIVRKSYDNDNNNVTDNNNNNLDIQSKDMNDDIERVHSPIATENGGDIFEMEDALDFEPSSFDDSICLQREYHIFMYIHIYVLLYIYIYIYTCD